MTSKQSGHAGAIASLKNLGPKSAAALAEVGIHDVAALGAVGPVAAYRRLKQARPREVTSVFLYALHGALTDTHWNALPAEIKAALMREANGE